MQHFRRSSKSSTKESSRDKKKEKEKEKEEKKKESEKPKHTRTKTAPDFPSLLRLPSSTSTVSASSKSRRATNPSTPTAAPSASTATSPSYFSPQAAASLNDARSPGTRRPPASFSGHGIDTSRGPPITLITRGNSDIARRTSQKAPTDYAHAQQQLLQSGLVSPSGSQSSSARGGRGEDSKHQKVESTPQHRPQQQTNTPSTTRRSSTSTARPAPPKQQYIAQPQKAEVHMASSVDDDDSSEYDSDSPSQNEEPPRATRPAPSRSNTKPKDSSESEQNEDLFLNIAADSAAKDRAAEAASRHDRLRSRIGRINRQSSPLPLQSPLQTQSSSATPTSSRATQAIDSRTATSHRRVSHQPTSSRTLAERTPLTPHTPIERPLSRLPDLSAKKSFSRGDAQLSPQDFLAQFNYTRRTSQPDVQYTPPARTGTYRPSNLNHYSTPREDRRAPEPEASQENDSRVDGTESHGSTGPAASVWDELDELKSRIRRIEMTGGKIPPTSGQVVSQASTERPRTANTSATTVSSSPNQQRKKSITSPPESSAASIAPSRTHPLLREALAKAKHHTAPSVYRFLEATAAEALTLAEMTGSAGPQGTLHSASSILGGASSADRQVRRKADNICRSLTELCIAMCDTKPSLAIPALRNANTITRRPSVQIQPDSPGVRQSIEPESNTLNISPSRALSRIEARKSTLMNGGQREASYEPYDDRHTSSRLSRAGTSLHRNRQSVDEDEEEPTLRAPSRAMTDFRAIRSNTERSRLSGRQYTSREPLPDFQQAPALQTSASLRRPTVSGTRNEQSLLFRDRGQFEPYRESSPAIERQAAGTIRARAQLAASRNPNNRNSIGGINELQVGRSISIGRRARGNSTGE